MSAKKRNVGELFILGFKGPTLPSWVVEFEKRFGLGGVILFDYDYHAKTYDNNIRSYDQVKALCQSLQKLPSRPLIFVDQEGGKVRRLKEKLGFAPLPSHFEFNKKPVTEKKELLNRSFHELAALGFHYNLAPVIDLNYNPQNPDIGAVERSFSANPDDVRNNVGLFNSAARQSHLGLCLKHYPGMGGALVNSHHELTDISGTITQEQLNLFYELAPDLSGGAVLISHGIVQQWDSDYPVSMSANALSALRAKLPTTLFISDDLQMQGLQKKLPTTQACHQGLWAGLDMLIIGNNLLPEELDSTQIAINLENSINSNQSLQSVFDAAQERIAARKNFFYKA